MEEQIRVVKIQSALEKHKELIVEKLPGDFIDVLYVQSVISDKDMDHLAKLDKRSALQKLIQCLDEKSLSQLTKFLSILKRYHSSLHREMEASILSPEISVWKVVKNVLRSMHAVLIKRLKVKDIAPEMYARTALTWDEYSSLDRDTERDQSQVNKEFFHYLRDKQEEAKVLGVFLQCLQMKQPDLYVMIQGEMEKFGIASLSEALGNLDVHPVMSKFIPLKMPQEVVGDQPAGACQALSVPVAKAPLEETSTDCSQTTVPCNVFTIVPIGESKAGKTSLMRTIITDAPCLMKEGQRTIVADPLRWIPPDQPDTVFMINDVGGQDTYKSTTPCFQVNSPSSLNILCHDITSAKYALTFYWLKATQTNAQDSKTIVILTKVDQLNPKTVTDKAKKFTRRFLALIDDEIKRTEELREKCDLQSSSWNIYTKNIQNYRAVKEQIQTKLPLVSCLKGWEDSVSEVRTLLTRFANDDKNRVVLRSVDRDLFLKIGELGIKPPMLEEQQNFQTERMHQQFITISEVMHVLEPILQQHNMKPKNSVKEAKRILANLSQKGLLGYFAGDEVLEQIIFNMPTVANILQCIFHHEIETYLQFETLDRGLRTKLYDDTKVKFDDDMNNLRQHGILSMPLLTLLLQKSKCLVEEKVVVQLLSHFDIGIPLDDESPEKKIFVPFFITTVFAPKDVAQIKQDILNCDTKVLSLHTVVKGNLPPAFFYQLLVKIHRNLKECHVFQKENLTWSKGLRASLGQSNARLLMLYNNNNETEFIIQADISESKGHCLMWDYVKLIDVQSKEIKLSRFPGLPFSYVLTCTCCLIGRVKSPDVWLVEKLLKSASMETFTCRNSHVVHAAMLRPLSEEEKKGKDFLDSLHKYLEAMVEELSPRDRNLDGRGNPENTKEYQASHKRFSKLRNMFCLFSGRGEKPSPKNQDEGYTTKGHQTKRKQMTVYDTLATYKTYAVPHSSTFQTFALEDASVLDLTHPTLQRNQYDLQTHMKATAKLLNLLEHFGLITEDVKNEIMIEASNIRKVNRILLHTDHYGVGGVEILADALRRCGNRENRKLGNTLEESVEGSYDQAVFAY